VDDEPLAIQGLELRLQAFDDVEIIEKCQNGREAIRAIKTHKPDLVFLDIQMPGFDGFSVVQGLMEVEPPLFVFVTAYSDHALKAFEAQAVDYLMKPVEESRLADTLDRVRQRLTEKRGGRGSREAARGARRCRPRGGGRDRRWRRRGAGQSVREADQHQGPRADLSCRCRHDRAHRRGRRLQCIYTGDNTLILRETMKDLEKRLDPPARVPARADRLDHRSISTWSREGEARTPMANGCLWLASNCAGQGVAPSYRRRGGSAFVH